MPKKSYLSQGDPRFLFLLQRLSRIRLRGAEGLPKHREEGHQRGEQDRHGEDPAVMLDAVGETFQVFATEPNGDWNADDGGDAHEKHVASDVAPQLAPHIAAEGFPDGDALGVLAAVVGAHGNETEKGEQDG